MVMPQVKRPFRRRGSFSSTPTTSIQDAMAAHTWQRPLLAIALIMFLFAMRRFWFPLHALASFLVPHPGCLMTLRLNDKGVWEGPWMNVSQPSAGAGAAAAGGGFSLLSSFSDDMSSSEFTGSELGRQLRSQGKLVALQEGDDDGRIPMPQVLEGLLTVGSLSTSSPLTLAFARLAEKALAPWVRIEGMKQGLGKTGMIKYETIKAATQNPKLALCIAHVRVVDGRIYYRYGSFLHDARKLLRINLSVKMLLEAVVRFDLRSIRADLLLNACDPPQSFDNSISMGKSGYPILSTQWTMGVTDIPWPDPLDLVFTLPPPHSYPKWQQRLPKAYWRNSGGSSSGGFDLELTQMNAGGSVFLRLHRLTDARPDLVDARVTEWGRKDEPDAIEMLKDHGVYLTASDLPPSDFRYRLLADHKVGTRELCHALSSSHAIIRHQTGFQHPLDALLLPGVHYVSVSHSFSDLVSAIEWMKANDAAVKEMVSNANAAAALLCTWDARVHYAAVLLAKYAARALESREAIQAPWPCKGGKALTGPPEWVNVSRWKDGWALCDLAKKGRAVAPCRNFCVVGVDPRKWTWLDAEESLRDIGAVDPLGSR